MTKVNGRQSLPALDSSKSVQNPDLLNIADKNYTSTIMRYSNLAILYSQLETEDKHIVGAINEINRKIQPAKKVGETTTVGGIIVGDGLDITDTGVLSANGGSGVRVEYAYIPSSAWEPVIEGRSYSYIYSCTTISDLDIYTTMVCPSNSLGYSSSRYMYLKYGVEAFINQTKNPPKLKFSTRAGKPNLDISIAIIHYPSEGARYYTTSILNPVWMMLPGLTTAVYNLLASKWDSNTHIYKLSLGSSVTDYSTQVILPMPSTSSQNITNNLALQEANIQDAGQEYGYIYLYAENIPSADLQIQVMCYA